MGDTEYDATGDHAHEAEHIPVPSGHAPRLDVMDALGGYCIYERHNPRAHIVARNPVDVRE